MARYSILSTPSTCIQFKPKSDKFALDEEHPGYRFIKLKANGEIETQVYRLSTSQRMNSSEVQGYDKLLITNYILVFHKIWTGMTTILLKNSI